MPTRKLHGLPANLPDETVNLYESLLGRYRMLGDYQIKLQEREREQLKAVEYLKLTAEQVAWPDESDTGTLLNFGNRSCKD